MSYNTHGRSERESRIASSGFTLMELIAVIATLTALMALLFPALAQSRRRGKLVVCTDNLRRIGAGLRQYAADYDGALPYAPAPTTQWQARVGLMQPASRAVRLLGMPALSSLLTTYHVMPSLFRCPLDRMNPMFRQEDPVFYKETWYEQVGASYDYDDQAGLKAKRLTSYTHPSASPLVWDLGYVDDGPAESRNILFVDSHVAVLPHAQFWPALARAQSE